ncbi:MAG: hypothetical protein IKC22_02180 [Bacilli bacterium]|nr:hypothetical protein [Bacilli bacterium]
MRKNSRFLETSATYEENLCDYRVEWDDHLGDFHYDTGVLDHDGPGSHYFFNDFDNAWDCFCDLRSDPNYVGVRLIQIRPDGIEFIRDSK